jgi:hypothetical protein
MENIIPFNLFELLLESKQVAKSRYYETGKITSTEWNKWLNMQNNFYKYLPTAIKLWLEDDRSYIRISFFQDLIYIFDDMKERNLIDNKDFDSYTLDDLLDVKELSTRKISKTTEIKNLKLEGADKLKETDEYILIKINTHKACIYYGANTKWCITSLDKKDWNLTTKTLKSQFYYLINKIADVDGEEKVCIEVEKYDNYFKASKIILWSALNEPLDLNDYLNKYNFQEVKNFLLPKEIEITDYIHGKWEINSNGEIDVDGDVILNDYDKSELDCKFGKIIGNFYCTENKFISLKGFPYEVTEDFDCSNNKLENLIGGPTKVGGNYHCDYNELISLEGSPKKIKGEFNCSHNKLENLIGGPNEVDGFFKCKGNPLSEDQIEFGKKYKKFYH